MSEMEKRISLDAEQIERIGALDCTLFKGLNTAERARFLVDYQTNLRSYPPDFLLRQQGSPQDDFGLLVSGSVEVRHYDDQGNVFTVDVLEAGELFGEMTAFVEPARWPATIVTADSAEVLLLPIRLLAEPSLTADQSISLRITANLLRLFADKAMNLRSRIDILTKQGMRQRIAAFLLQRQRQHGRASFTISLNREGMARYLNVSRPSMSRELGRMQDEGLIQFERNRFTILDQARLIRESGSV